MEFFSFLAGTNSEVADFYAGMINTTFDLDIRKDLQACMVRDEVLTTLWDIAIEELTKEDDEFDRYFEMALDVSPHDMEACGKIPKVAIAGKQLAFWWETFWAQEGAEDILESNYMEKDGKATFQVIATRMDWELGYYYDAGKRFGNLWNILIGKPEWSLTMGEVADVGEEVVEPAAASCNIMAVYQGSALAELFNDDQVKTLESCVVYDPIEVEMMAQMIDSLSDMPDKQFVFDRYFGAVQALESYNWAPCVQDKAVADLIDRDNKWFIDFWSQKDAASIMEANIKKNGKELGETIEALQVNWNKENYAIAGKKYGYMWSLLMGGKPTNDNTVYGWSE